MKPLIFFFSILINISVIAQNKVLSIEDALVKNRTSLSPENLKHLQFIYGTDDYVYLKKNDDKNIWVKGNINSTEESVFLTLEDLNQKLSKAGYSALKTFPEIQFDKAVGWILTADSSKISLNANDGSIKAIVPKTFAAKEFTEESKAGYIAFLDHYDLHVGQEGKKAFMVTKDGSKDIVYAQAVHRNEFGINKGIFWSNAGKLLAFYRMDQRMVNDYPIIDWSQSPAKNENIKYPMAGGKSHHVTVGIYNAETRKTFYLKTGLPAEQYLTNIAWSPDDKFLYIAVLNRGQNHMKLNQYSAVTGNFIKTLFEEKDEKYTEPLVPMLFLKNDPSQFIWQSNRDGFNHLYLYNTNGSLIRQLTKGNWEVTDVKGFDASGDNLFYISTEESPLTKNIYQLNIRTGIIKRISVEPGVHTAKLSTNGNCIIDVFSNTNTPRMIRLTDIKTGQSKTLLAALNPLADYSLGSMD
ncbi:MAG: DPP IV N-terminal domain-containing protein, partial [Ferruginibacter sp.]